VNDNTQALAQELQKRITARRDIYAFIETMEETGLLDFKHQPAEHHHILIDAMMALIFDAAPPKLIVALPPGAAKSTYLSIILPCFLLARDSTKQILCLSASESLAENFARRRRSAMKTPQWIKLAQTSLAADAQSLAYQGTEKGGSIVSAGAGSTIQGLRADYIIVDDPISGFEQANSVNQTDKLASWYFSEARSRLKPNGKEIIVATRWSIFDLSQKMLDLHLSDKEEWKYIRIPMECDDPENDPLNREMGAPLWPEWFTPEMRADAKRDPQIWQTLYQQRPLTESGSFIPPEHIHIKPREDLPPTEKMKIYIGTDIALSIQKGDFTVFIVCGVTATKDIVVLDMYRKQVSPDVSSKVFVEMCRRFNPAACFIDNDNASKVWQKLVYEVAQKAHVAAPLQLVKMKGKDKETRAAPMRSYFLQDRIKILMAPWNTPLIDELNLFPAVRHDDTIDALGLVASELIKIVGATRAPAPMPTQQFLDSKDGQMYLSQDFENLFESNRAKKNFIQKRRI